MWLTDEEMTRLLLSSEALAESAVFARRRQESRLLLVVFVLSCAAGIGVAIAVHL